MFFLNIYQYSRYASLLICDFLWIFVRIILVPPMRLFDQKPYESLGIKLYIILVETRLIILLYVFLYCYHVKKITK